LRGKHAVQHHEAGQDSRETDGDVDQGECFHSVQ
jgi:hypothetical protein